jgi:hypothetical protein
MTIAIDTTTVNTITLPQAGEIWLPIDLGEPVIVTGVLEEDSGPAVYFSNLETLSFVAPLGYFMESFDKRS